MKHQGIKSEIPDEMDQALFIDAIFADMGVTSSLFLCKAIRYLRKDDYSASALAKEMGMCSETTTHHLKRLALNDYVYRSGHTSWSLGLRTIDVRYPINSNKT